MQEVKERFQDDKDECEGRGQQGYILKIKLYQFRPTRSETGVNEMSRGRPNDPGPSDIYRTNKQTLN